MVDIVNIHIGRSRYSFEVWTLHWSYLLGDTHVNSSVIMTHNNTTLLTLLPVESQITEHWLKLFMCQANTVKWHMHAHTNKSPSWRGKVIDSLLLFYSFFFSSKP